ncbi:MAG: DUF512 domain-containing protein [Microthrixaceae bacterium]
MSRARVVAVDPGSPAALAGVCVGDDLVAVNGRPVRDVIEYQVATDAAEVQLGLDRGGVVLDVEIVKPDGRPLGIEVQSAVFDRVRTCDNHCEFCFIYQLPKGMRRSLYLKDDDYRLSFLYGNFTTLTRFTEADLERVIDERLSPLFVSIHATDPVVRNEMLKNRRGAMSLRWLSALLEHGIEVHGQIVVCPGLNDGAVLEDSMCGILDRYSRLADVALVPLGVSKFNTEPRMRPHTADEAAAVCTLVDEWQPIFERLVGRPMVFAADEYYLMADRPFPEAGRYGDFDMYEDGIGMARAFEADFMGRAPADRPDPGGRSVQANPGGGLPTPRTGAAHGFFHWVDGAPAEGYRAPRATSAADPVPPVRLRRPVRPDAPVGVLTAPYGARVLRPLLETLGRPDVRIVEVPNDYFGGNVAVSGLMVGADLAAVLATQPEGHRYLLPDVCLSGGRFLDGTTVEDLPRPVEVIATDGATLRRSLDVSSGRARRVEVAS